MQVSVVAGRRLSSCDVVAPWQEDPPGPGTEPVTPALAGGFLSTMPPGSPRNILKQRTALSPQFLI